MAFGDLAGILASMFGRQVEVAAKPVIVLGMSGNTPVPMAVSASGGSNVTIAGTTQTGNTTSTTTNISIGGPTTISAGALSIEFILFPSAVGTINGATFDNTSANVIGIYRLDAPPWKPLSALTYTLSAGAGVLTVQT